MLTWSQESFICYSSPEKSISPTMIGQEMSLWIDSLYFWWSVKVIFCDGGLSGLTWFDLTDQMGADQSTKSKWWMVSRNQKSKTFPKEAVSWSIRSNDPFLSLISVRHLLIPHFLNNQTQTASLFVNNNSFSPLRKLFPKVNIISEHSSNSSLHYNYYHLAERCTLLPQWPLLSACQQSFIRYIKASKYVYTNWEVRNN